MKNHVQKIYDCYVKEPDSLQWKRYLFAGLMLLGLYLYFQEHYFYGSLSTFISMAFGEFHYKKKVQENKLNNKELIKFYLKENTLYSQEHIKILADQFLVRSQGTLLESTKISALLAALLAPYYLKAIDLLFTDVKSLIFSMAPILIVTLVLLVIILNAELLLHYIFWFINKKQRIYKDISWYLIEEIMLEVHSEQMSPPSVA